jgi:sulfate adenylyltransferase
MEKIRRSTPHSALDVPRWRPSAVELDDLSMILLGAYPGVDGFGPPASSASPVPPTLVLPTAVATSAREQGAVVLVDEEGVPQATLTVDDLELSGDGRCLLAGKLTPSDAPPRGSHPGLRVPVPRGAPTGPVLGVLVDRPVHLPRLVQIRAAADALGARVLLLPMTGHDRPRGVDGPALVRTCLAVRALLDADVVPIAVPRHVGAADEADDALVRGVATAYGASHVVATHRSAGALELPEVALDLRSGLWAPAVDVPTVHRSERTLIDVEDHLTAITEGRVDAEPELFDRTMQRELRRVRPGGRVGFSVLFTGLSGSGKSTIAQALRDRLLEHSDRTVTLLDGDVVRSMLSSELSFSREHRVLNIRRIGYVASEITRHGGIAICAPIAPYDDSRREMRARVQAGGAGFVLVHVATPLDVCEGRDRKGLYARARAGRIPEFTGISDPYEEPVDADVVTDTLADDPAEVVDRVLAVAVARGWLELD